jgi:hypothetical protein
VPAERAAAAAAMAYYARPAAAPAPLRALVGIVDREAPGIVELSGSAGEPGFEVRAAERPFPRGAEGELRQAAAALLATPWGTALEKNAVSASIDDRWWQRLVRAVRRLFSAAP